MRCLRRALGVFFLSAAILTAQSPTRDWNALKSVSAGTEIRVALPESETVRGRMESVTETALVLRTGGRSESIERSRVTRVSILTKARRRRNMLIGMGIGAAGGAALGGAAAAICSGSLCGGYGVAMVTVGIAGAAILGTLIGVAVSHHGWREVYRQ